MFRHTAQNAANILVNHGKDKSKRLAGKVAEAHAKGDSSLLAKMWAYRGLIFLIHAFRSCETDSYEWSASR